ncbi:MAG: histidine--tRNA ligase [candidate division Zixibacteria bacterium]|nr:histidine--tRNA ligase [candidate division Zixibacteria bacterium]
MTSLPDIHRLQGTADLLPAESFQWAEAERVIRATMFRFGFGEIRFPVLEPTELFARGTGASTDIVQKEMYTLVDRGGRSLTLRPEGTPSVVRAYLEENLGSQRPVWKLFYLGPMFRAERPQKGRYRQFHQFGAEMIGAASPESDVELIALARTILHDLGLTGLRLQLNSIGSPAARHDHSEKLRAFLRQPDVYAKIDEDCRRRMETNPLRVFDCKNEECIRIMRHAPTIDQFLTAEDQDHFARVRSGLESLGISYELDPRMVRGLDYYTRTTFEFKTDLLGAQDTVCGGGRYDLLVETFGGPATPAVGFASGIERILAAAQEAGASQGTLPRLDVFVGALGDQARALIPSILARLRGLGFSADSDFLGRGLKAQMKEANRLAARLVLIVGDDEITRGQFTLRRMDEGGQAEIPADLAQWNKETFA